MSHSCVKHPMAVAEHVCGRCGHDFCPECVVFPHGPSRPATCIACALELGGIRRRDAGRPPRLSRREIKRKLRAQRGQGDPAAPVPATAPDPEPDDERAWLEGGRSAEEFPGGWRRTF